MARQVCAQSGSWSGPPQVIDSPHESCPAILSRYSWTGTLEERMETECCTGEVRKAMLQSHSYVSCSGEGPLPLETVLGALRGKKVAFVGDSTMGQLWTALTAQLYARRRPIEITMRVPEYNLSPASMHSDEMCTVNHNARQKIGGSENVFRFDAAAAKPCSLLRHNGSAFNAPGGAYWPLRPTCLSIPDQEIVVPDADARFLFYRMDANASKKPRLLWNKTHFECGTAKRNFEDKIDAAIREADVILASIGLWYGSTRVSTKKDRLRESDGNRPQADYRSDVSFLLQRLKAARAKGKLGLFREPVPQHFPKGDTGRPGSGLFEEYEQGRGPDCPTACSPLAPDYAELHDWRTRTVHEAAAAVGFSRIVPTAAFLRPLYALHKPVMRRYGRCSMDCTHLCYDPTLWAALLDAVYRSILRHRLVWGRGQA